MIDQLLSVIAPHRCSSCGELGGLLCESCKQDIISDPFSGCVLCQAPCGERGVCGHCLAQGFQCEQAWCVGERAGGLKRLLDTYKFQSGRAGAQVCTELLDSLLPVLPAHLVVTGVPTSPLTLRARGFDHVGLIVKALAKKRHLAPAIVLKRTNYATLHFLTKPERQKLSTSLFEVKKVPIPETVLLLDDIVTTGTTLKAAVKVLKAAGVARVYVAVVARQPSRSKK